MLKFVATFLFVVLLHLTGARPTDDNDELIAVAVVFRHGDRTIIDSYPNDPYLNYSWPVGLGQLTNQGKQRHYELGQWFRQRYNNFLPKRYSEKDIYVLSSDVDRALMSAAANLAGLYPPEDDQIWDETLNWQPIPIHALPIDMDNLLHEHKECKKYNELFQKNLDELDQEMYELYGYAFDVCSANSGKEFTSIDDFSLLSSVFEIEEGFGLPLPDWTNQIYPEPTEVLTGLKFAAPAYTEELAHFITGPFFDHLLKIFENRLQNVEERKFFMFSAHDTTVANILMSMGVFDYDRPPFACTIIFELRGKEEPYINLFYKKFDKIKPLTVKDCELNCKFENFSAILDNIRVDQETWEEECLNI